MLSRNRLNANSLRFFIFISTLLPTGYIFGLNFKMLSMIGALSLYLTYFRGIFILKFLKNTFIPMSLVILFFSISVVFYDNYTTSIQQAKDIVTLIVIVSIGVTFSKDSQYENNIFIPICYALSFLSVCKMLMFAYSSATGMSVSAVTELISNVFGVKLMSLNIEDSIFGRIQFVSDNIIPFVIYIFLRKMVNVGLTKIESIHVVLLSFSILIAMSRFYWAITLLLSLVALRNSFMTKKGLIYLIVIFFVLFYAISLESVQSIIDSRLSSKLNDNSDSYRVIQFYELSSKIDDKPVLGWGLGYYIPDYIRSGVAKYSYELQLVSLVMQIGFLGVSIFFMYIFFIYRNQSRQLNYLDSLIYFMMYIIWVSSGLFNPMLFSSAGGMSLLILYIMPFVSKDNNINKPQYNKIPNI